MHPIGLAGVWRWWPDSRTSITPAISRVAACRSSWDYILLLSFTCRYGWQFFWHGVEWNVWSEHMSNVELFRSSSLWIHDVTFKLFTLKLIVQLFELPDICHKDERVGLSRQGGGRYGRATVLLERFGKEECFRPCHVLLMTGSSLSHPLQLFFASQVGAGFELLTCLHFLADTAINILYINIDDDKSYTV